MVLERDPQNPNLRWARQKGLLLVQGDGAETEDLWRVKLLKAHEVFVCIGADETNISCLTTIHEL
ncbi:MAG: NAD-binding protein, partial [Planctomycetaceae bacterium]